MKRKLMLSFLLLVCLGCATNMHTIGKGPKGNSIVEERQWYVLWGLVPINKVDSKAMAAGAENYQIKTEASALDVVINIFTNWVTVTSRTVTVTK
jgi:hypothetical protein